MEVHFTQAASGMLFRMFMQPGALAPDQPYKASDPLARKDILDICTFLVETNKVAELVDGRDGKMWVFKPWTGKLKERFIRRIKDVVEHHKEAGALMHNAVGYEELAVGLNGKKLEPESIEEDDGVQFKSKSKPS